jgi:hypothetical protein
MQWLSNQSAAHANQCLLLVVNVKLVYMLASVATAGSKASHAQPPMLRGSRVSMST